MINKIIYFLDNYTTMGGAANTILRQAVLMKQYGIKVSVAASDYGNEKICSEYKDICKRADILYHMLSFSVSTQPEDIDILSVMDNYESVKDFIQEEIPDIVHSVQLNVTVELVCRELNIPHIMNIYPLLSDFFSVAYMDVFPHYHICDSWYWARKWNQYIHTDYTCIRTIAYRESKIAKEDFTDKKIKYICVGAIYKDKNQLAVIRAFHKALKNGVSGELALYGSFIGTYAEECREYIEENRLTECISLKGFTSEIQSAYNNSDVLICGSTRESYPNVISEAMANDLIIISTPVSGVPEVIKDRYNGYLTDDYSVEAIERKILEFNDDLKRNAVQKIRENSRLTFEQVHSEKAVEKKLLEYYAYVIRDNQKSSLVGIEDIKKEFGIYKYIFDKNYNSFKEPAKIAKKIWYLNHVKSDIEAAVIQKKSFYIWGTGNYGCIVKEMIDVFLPEIEIAGFFDTNKTGKFYDYEIYRPDYLLHKKNSIIFVAVTNGQKEVIEILEYYGFRFNRTYFILSARLW